jgi:hypothetical protein
MYKIRKSLEGLIVPDSFNEGGKGYYNYSIYFDTISYKYYREKHEGLLYRIKPRIRVYRSNLDGPISKIFLEFKIKYDRIVKKERTAISKEMMMDIISGAPKFGLHDKSLFSDPVISRLYSLTKKYYLKPKVTVYYNRSAFYSDFYPNIRLTFDSNIKGSLSVNGDGLSESFAYILPPHFSMIELKYNNKLPKIFISKIQELELRQTTFSKYATALEVCTEKSIISNNYKNKLIYSGLRYESQ